MDAQLATKTVEEIKKFSSVRCAITNDLGTVLAKSDNFTINHPLLNTASAKAYKIGYDKKNYGYLYIDEDRAVRTHVSSALISMAELIIKQNRHSQILTSDEKRIDQITYDFLFANSIEVEDYANILKSFDIDISLNRTAILIEICDPNYLMLFEQEIIEGEREKVIARTKRGIEGLLAVFYTQHTENLVFYLGGQNFLILKDMGINPVKYQEEFKKTLQNLHFNLENELRTKITIGVGEYKSGLLGVRESFTEARTALKFGEQTWGIDKIYHFDNFGVIAPLFSGANKDNINFSRKMVTSIAEHNGLLKTLRCYLDNDLSLTKTAKTLKIHRNTLVYRLERIEDISGLDPRLFNDAFQLKIALILDQYHA
jgi:carbohydrate diacid regulator